MWSLRAERHMDKTIQFHIQFQILPYTFMLMLETKIWYSIVYMRMLNALISRIYFKPHAHVTSFTFALPRNYDFSLCIETYQWNGPTRQSLRVVIDILCHCSELFGRSGIVIYLTSIIDPSINIRISFNGCEPDVFCSKGQANHNGNSILILHWTRH